MCLSLSSRERAEENLIYGERVHAEDAPPRSSLFGEVSEVLALLMYFVICVDRLWEVCVCFFFFLFERICFHLLSWRFPNFVSNVYSEEFFSRGGKKKREKARI